ncbi:MAG: hypothetical protein F6K42_02770 [Leptolyngbya sp. SIO1D8]|nr:hypothetical protein [Leptolyngbya sp. SIO1D8]
MNSSVGQTSIRFPQVSFKTTKQELCQAWAQRYIRQVDRGNTEPICAVDSRQEIADKLRQVLRNLSAKAWGKTEELIAKEVIRHQINPGFIDPWAISQDVCRVYSATLKQYAEGIKAEWFALDVAQQIGQIRDRYTAHDPRVIGVVSMQFHYTGQLLLGCTYGNQKAELEPYFKAIDDHLYLPLKRTYEAAAAYEYDALELKAIRRLMPASSQMAVQIVDQASIAFPHYHSYSGPLASSLVRISSIRDVEMFQVYLWVCLLEGNEAIVQQELFPLCVMLYPVLNVRWELVRYMLILLEHEIGRRLEPAQWKQFKPHLANLKRMFSTAVFPSQLRFA